MSDITLEQTEEGIKELISLIAEHEGLARLRNNPDFRKLFLENYLVTEASRLVALKADQNFDTPDKQARLDNAIIGIGQFGAYLNSIEQSVGNFKDQLTSYETLREELLEENLNN